MMCLSASGSRTLGVERNAGDLAIGSIWVLLNLPPSQKHKLMVLLFIPTLPEGMLAAVIILPIPS
jgi:hypothetical protein